MKFETHIAKLDYLMGVTYLYIPKEKVLEMGGLKCGRLICTVNTKESFQCGFMSLGNGDAYITINKARLKKLGLQAGDQVRVELTLDESEYGMDMCEELAELFEQEPHSKIRFDELKPGMQRSLIYYISSAKSGHKRLERAMSIIGNLNEIPNGKETFRNLLGKP